MAGILQKGARRFTTQIGAAGVPDAVTTTIPLVSVTGLPTDTPIELVIDRTDASGNLTPVKEEVVRGTVSGTNLINCVRGVEGTAQAHSAGATVNSFLTASMWNNIIEYTRDLPTRGLINGLIVPTVAGNNLTVAIKTLQNTDPSPANPVYVWINNTLRSITSALSVTSIAGLSYFNAGSAELATREIDYFVYLGYGTVSNRVFIGYSRLPYGRLQSDFNTSVIQNERFLDRNEVANNTDSIVNVGRFTATNSGTPSFNWSVPSFTNANIIQEPIYETRRLSWQTTFSLAGSGTLIGNYKIANSICYIWFASSNITIASASIAVNFTMPISSSVFNVGMPTINDNAGYVSGRVENQPNSNLAGVLNSTGTGSNWTTGTGEIYLQHYYTIQ